MLSSLFHYLGLFCTNHPWEMMVVVFTLTTAMTSVAFFGDLNNAKVCGWNYKCPDAQDTQSSDIIVLTIARCLAVAYIYSQFRKLDGLGSRYILGLAGLFSIVSSVIFSAGFVHMFNLGYEVYGLGDALPFFLLVLDLSKVTTFAKYTMLHASDEVGVRETVARGMAVVGPTLFLDTLVEVLVIGIGSFSGIPTLELICRFGCVSLIVNYIVFMTFFPASLCLALEIVGERQSGFVVKGKKQDLLSNSNPVARRIKIIMSIGLFIVHVYSRWTHVEVVDSDFLAAEKARRLTPTIPLWEFYLRGMFEFTPEQVATYGFICLLVLKYFLFDSATKAVQKSSLMIVSHQNGAIHHGKNGFTPVATEDMVFDAVHKEKASRLPTLSCHRRRTFTVGEDDDELADEVAVAEKFQKKLSPVTVPVVPVLRVDPDPPSVPDVALNPVKLPTGRDSEKKAEYAAMTDAEILRLVATKQISAHKLEEELGDTVRAIHIRRMSISPTLRDPLALAGVPYKDYDYSYVNGNCCENVIGYIPIPLGYAGPLKLDGALYQVPLATTEGCLVASINRGCRAVTLSGGAVTHVDKDAMTRGPVVRMPSLHEAAELTEWIKGDGFETICQVFNRTSRFARLQSIKPKMVGELVYLRFAATTGDAMGMNMLCKGTERALHAVQERFPQMQVIALSGNYCIDKKASALNWIEGRGKSVNCTATITADVLRNVLKTTAAELEQLNIDKNLIGSSMAGSVGGQNAHAANAVGAIFLATGQDVAQVVGSSMCITVMKRCPVNPDDLKVSCTMPCLEVGTVGGGTNLPPQGACLKALGIQGSSPENPGENAKTLARVICGTVLAAELSLMAALAAGQLVQSHLKHNRSKVDLAVPRGPVAHRRANSLQEPSLGI